MDNIQEWTSLPPLNHSSCSPNDPVGQGTDLNWSLVRVMYVEIQKSMVQKKKAVLKEGWPLIIYSLLPGFSS